MGAERSSIVVIGAGISGLSTAVYAARCGFDVTIVEHGAEPGGVCTSWRRDGYTVDGCIHWLMGSKEGSPFWTAYREVGATDGVEYLPIDRLTEVADQRSRRRATVWADLDAFVDELAPLGHSDEKALRDLIADARAFEGMDYPVETAHELAGPLTTLRTMWRLRSEGRLMLKYRMSAAEWAERLEDPFNRLVIHTMFGADAPMSFNLMVLAELEAGSLARIRGGSKRFADAIAARFESLGGTIRYGWDVEEILVDHDRAVGVRSTTGEELRGDRIVSTAPGYATIFRMLGGRYADDELRERYTKWKTFPPIALVSFGVERTWPDVSSSIIVQLDEPFWTAHLPVEHLMLRVFNDDDSLAPEGCTVVQVILETPFDYWHDQHHSPRSYRLAKERLSDSVLKHIEPILPGISTSVAMRDVATPYTFWRYARSWRGAYEGFLPTAETMMRPLKKTLPGLDRFYMGGQWTTPGGGVPPAVMSGRHVVQLICRDTGRPFVADA